MKLLPNVAIAALAAPRLAFPMNDHLAAPELTYEDLSVGRLLRTGKIEVSREELLAFSARYDPQAFHLEEAAGRGSVFGGMAASGWFTAALTMRLMILGEFKFRGGAVGLGVEAIRWPRPVHVGDQLTAVTEVAAMRGSASKPAFGVVKFVTTTINQRGEVVMTKTANVLVPRRRDSGPATPGKLGGEPETTKPET